MTENSSETSGTTSGQSTGSSDGSGKRSGMSLEGLLRGDNLNGQRKTEVPAPEGGIRERDDDSRVSRLRRTDTDAEGEDGTDDAGGKASSRRDGDDAGEDAALDRILKALQGATGDQDGSEGQGEGGEKGGEGRSEADRSGGFDRDDGRERPPGVKKGQRTIKMLAEDLDMDPAALYENLMVPLNDGTGHHMSLERLRAAAMGTDADLVAQERVEHEQRLAAFEVDKSEHETTVVRDRKEVSTMLKLLQAKLPPEVVKVAKREAQRQLAQAAQDMLERFPAWRDPHIAAAWQSKAFSCLKRHGFSKADAASITDARLCAFIDEHMKLRDWAAKVRNPEALPKRPAKSSRHAERSGRKRNSKAELLEAAKQPGATPEQKTAAIVSLLAEGLPR